MDERQQSLRNARLLASHASSALQALQEAEAGKEGARRERLHASQLAHARNAELAVRSRDTQVHSMGMAYGSGTNHSSYTHPLPSHPFYYQAVDAEAAEASVGALRYRLDGKHAQEEVHTLIRRTQRHHTAKHSAAHRAPITLTTLRTLLSTPHTAMPFTLSLTHTALLCLCLCVLALLLLHRCCATT